MAKSRRAKRQLSRYEKLGYLIRETTHACRCCGVKFHAIDKYAYCALCEGQFAMNEIREREKQREASEP